MKGMSGFKWSVDLQDQVKNQPRRRQKWRSETTEKHPTTVRMENVHRSMK